MSRKPPQPEQERFCQYSKCGKKLTPYPDETKEHFSRRFFCSNLCRGRAASEEVSQEIKDKIRAVYAEGGRSHKELAAYLGISCVVIGSVLKGCKAYSRAVAIHPDKDGLIRKMHFEGKSDQSIATAIGASNTSVTSYRKRNGISRTCPECGKAYGVGFLEHEIHPMFCCECRLKTPEHKEWVRLNKKNFYSNNKKRPKRDNKRGMSAVDFAIHHPGYPKTMKCKKCGEEFKSEHAGNQHCDGCRRGIVNDSGDEFDFIGFAVRRH